MPATERPPFTWQLDGGGYQLDLRSALGGQQAPPDHWLPWSADAPPVPAVLLLSRAADAEIGQVQRLLTAIGVPVVRLDAETASRSGLLIDLSGNAVRLHGRWIRPTVAWLRHFSARAMTASGSGVRQLVSLDSWQQLAEQLAALSSVPMISPGPGVLSQLEIARAHQVAVPATVVTADVATARELLGGGRVIVKAVVEHFAEASPGLLTGVFPEVIEPDAMATADAGLPVLVQEYVPHDQEVRVYFSHGALTAFAIAKSAPAQPWLDPGQVGATLIDPPPAVAAAVATLAAAMAIEFGAFDFLVAADVPVFLEVNLSGDWRWLETKLAANPVTKAVVTMLRDLHAQVTGTASSGMAVNPVTFLSGGRHSPVDKGVCSL